jgi:hypothetical protein
MARRKLDQEKTERKYEKPSVKVMSSSDILRAVKKGAKFPARGFAG